MNRREFIKLIAGTAAGLALAPALSGIEKYLPKDHDYKKSDTIGFWVKDKHQVKDVKYFQGKMAMVRIWNRCLSQKEIQKIYDREKHFFEGEDGWKYVHLSTWDRLPSGLWCINFDSNKGGG